MRLPCPTLLTVALLTLACQGAPATNTGDAGKPAAPAAPTAPASPTAPPTSHGTPNPHGADPHAGMQAGAPVVRAPVNPGPVTPSGQVRAETLAELSFSVPTEWIRKPGSNAMRLAEFTLPGPGGEATLIASRFAGGGGDAASNVNRWKTQFTSADGSPITEVKEQTSERAPLKVTTVDITGTNIAAVTPGAPERYNEPNSRLLGLIVEGVGDPVFFKVVGSAQTLDVWEPAFKRFADSVTASK
ncbi:MAG TPA: hypothetical protein VGB85_02395 [Nannocystis sp.]|jgi:hypothetical protein